MIREIFSTMALNFLVAILVGLLEKGTNTMEIHRGNKIPLAFTKIFEGKKGCTEIQVPNNYKKLVLKLNSNNLDRILVTDMKINQCSENYNIKACCSKNATFCMENSNPTQNEFHLNYCIDYTYIYACVSPDDPIFHERNNQDNKIVDTGKDMNTDKTNNTNSSKIISLDSDLKNETNGPLVKNNTNSRLLFDNNPKMFSKQKENIIESNILFGEILGNIKVDADIKRGEGCTTAEYLPETECSTIGLLNCRDQTKCNKNCIYVECRQAAEDPKSKVFSMCLPADLRDSDIESKCKNHAAFKEIIPQPFKINCTNTIGFNYVRKDSSHTFFKFLLVIFGVFLLALFISSIYYRYHCSNYKNEPFDPPSFCPNFVYPRSGAF